LNLCYCGSPIVADRCGSLNLCYCGSPIVDDRADRRGSSIIELIELIELIVEARR
jgi:hypothetical protein